jgi:hypothetical protein
MLVGTEQSIVAKLETLRLRWGITRYTVRSLEPIAKVIAAIG